MKKAGLILGVIFMISVVWLMSGCGSPQPSKPAAQIISEGIARLSALKSAVYELSLKGDIKDPKSADMTFDLGFSGSADVKDTDAIKFTVKVVGTAVDKSDMGGDVDAEIRLDKDNMYFAVTSLDIKGQPLPADVTALFKKWWSYKLPVEVTDQLKTMIPSAKSGATQEQDSFNKLLSGANIFATPTFAGAESVKGEMSFHFKVSLDKKGLVDFMKKIAESEGKSITDSDVADIEKSLESVEVAGDVWVGTQSLMLNQVKGIMTVKATEESPQNGTITFAVTLGDINKPVTVEVPAGVQEFTMDKAAPIMMMFYSPSIIDSGTQSLLQDDINDELSPDLLNTDLGTDALVNQ